MNYKTTIDNHNNRLENDNTIIDNLISNLSNLPSLNNTTAINEDVLEGKTYFANGMLRTGTMNNIGQQIIIPNDSVQNIARGYHDGTGYVDVGLNTSDANAQPINMKNGVIAYTNVGRIVGNLPVLTYPVNPQNSQDWNYQFIAANHALKNVSRNSVNYIIGEYQVADSAQPDSWMFEGNRKMKMGFEHSDIANIVNLTPDKLKLGVSILGVDGNVAPDKPDQTKTVDPTTNQQVITADIGYELASVTINAVTSNIDQNIVAGNIKENTNILGVTGTLKDTTDATASEDDILLNKTAYVDNEKLTGTFDADTLYNIIDEDHSTMTKAGVKIDIDDAISYKAKLELTGRTYQKQLSGKNIFDEDSFDDKTLYQKEANYYAYVELPATFKTTFYANMFLKGTAQNLVAGFTTVKSTTFSGGNRVLNRDVLNSNVECDFAEAEHVYFAIGNPNGINLETDIDAIFNNYHIQCTLNAEETPTFEEYCGGQPSPSPDYPQEIKIVTGSNILMCVGKNLLNPSRYVPKAERENYIEYKNEVFTVIQANYNKQSYIFSNINLDPTKFEDGFTFFVIVEGTHTSGNLIFYNTNGSKIGSELIINTSNTKKVFRKHFITQILSSIKWFDPKNTVGTTYRFFIVAGNVSVDDAEFINYLGNEYPIDLGDMELCKIDEYEDVIFKNEPGNKYYNSNLVESAWYKLQRINKLLSNGSENTWSVNATYDDAILYRRNLPANVQKIDGLYNILANNLPANGNDGDYSIMGQTSGKHIQIRLSKKYATDVSELKQWLSNNNVYSYYPLATPIYILITDATLITQLDRLTKIIPHKGINHIWSETNNLNPNLELTYKREIKYQDKTVSLSTIPQTINTDNGYDGLNQVIINAVTNTIDANIQPENIKQGIQILNIDGTLQGTSNNGFTLMKYQPLYTDGGDPYTNPEDYNASMFLFPSIYDGQNDVTSIPEMMQLTVLNNSNNTFKVYWTDTIGQFYVSYDDTNSQLVLNVGDDVTNCYWCSTLQVNNIDTLPTWVESNNINSQTIEDLSRFTWNHQDIINSKITFNILDENLSFYISNFITGIDTEQVLAEVASSSILSNRYAYDRFGRSITGTMQAKTVVNLTNNRIFMGANTVNLKTTAGYYTANSYIQVNNLGLASKIGLTAANLPVGVSVLNLDGTYTSDANATASDIALGKTAYVNGQKINGEIDWASLEDYKNRITSNITELNGTEMANIIQVVTNLGTSFSGTFLEPLMYSRYNFNDYTHYLNLGKLLDYYPRYTNTNIHFDLPAYNTVDSIDISISGMCNDIDVTVEFSIDNARFLQYHCTTAMGYVDVNTYQGHNEFSTLQYFSDIFGYADRAIINIDTTTSNRGIDLVTSIDCLRDLGITFYSWGRY